MNTQEPTYGEIKREVNLLKCNKAPGPDGLHPSLFKEGDQYPAYRLERRTVSRRMEHFHCHTDLQEECQKPMRKLDAASKVLSGLILRRLTDHHEGQIRENQAGVSFLFNSQH